MGRKITIKELARELRKNPTKSEKILWEYLRKRRFKGLRFLRQYPIIHEERYGELFFYIADFYCSEVKLVLELDGKVHDYQKESDFNRDFVMRRMGLKVLRIKNEELGNIEAVLEKIRVVTDIG